MNTSLKLNKHALGLIGLLAVQYLLGMSINLYVKFPESQTQSELWNFSMKQPLITSHIGVAILLFFGALVLVYSAHKTQSTAWKIPAWTGLIALLVASSAGSQFIPTQSDPQSFLMAAAFLVAFGAYGWGVCRSK